MNRLLLLLVQVVTVTFEYEVRCPVSGERRFRYRKFNCSSQEYVCLLVSPGNIYNETCDGPDYISPGSKLIFQPTYFNKAGCKYNRYQPFAFSTSETSDCVFKKSLCNEEGQILFNEGSFRNNIACGCNFSTGFNFITKPKNNSFCVPSEEDCSCYKPTCYSIDNQCDYVNIDTLNTSIPEITTKTLPNKDKYTPVLEIEFNETQYVMDYNIKGFTNRIKPLYYLLALLIAMVFTFSMCVLMVETLSLRITAEKQQIHTDYGKSIEVPFKVNIGRELFVRSVDWYRNGDRIECLRNPTKYSLHGKSPILTIKDVDNDDLGEYKCVIKTMFRQVESTNISLTKKMPKEMPNTDSSEKKIFMEAIKSGQEVRRYVRIHLIGKDGVGKSSLVQRLLNAEVTDVKSTDGIDIVKTCYIRASDGKWIYSDVDGSSFQRRYKLKVETEREEMIRRIQAVSIKQRRKQSISDESKQFLDDTGRNQNVQKLMSSNDISLTIGNEPNNSIINQEDTLSKVNVNEIPTLKNETTHTHTTLFAANTFLDENKLDIEEIVDVHASNNGYEKSEITRSNEMRHSNGPFYQNSNPKFSGINNEITMQISNKMEEVILEIKTKSKQMKSEDLIECGIWDFAGQKDYYVTHQTFLTPHAIYLIVANVKEDIKDIKHDENYDSIGEYVDFWFDSIHCLCDDPTAEKLNPPVIMVFTHTDECQKVEERTKEILEKFQDIIGCQPKGNHKRSVHFISNKPSFESDVNGLKNKIAEIAKEMEYFADVLPTNWIQLENALAVFKDLKINILAWDNMVELGGKLLIKDKEQLIGFLTYQHKIGNIIFFEEISDYIILQPNWLIKCFRCLVCDSDRKKRNIDLLSTTDLRLLTDTGELSDKMIDQLFQKEPDLEFEKYKLHLLNVMEKFDIIIKPQLLCTVSDNCLPYSSYFMPCMIRKQPTTIDFMRKTFGGDGTDFSTSPWLILEFVFLPLAYFNHILFYFLRKYTICEEENGHKGIYGGKAVFFLDNTKFRKLLICFSKNALSLQIWKWGNIDDVIFRTVLEELCFKIKKLDNKFNHFTSYNIKAKCSIGDYSKRLGRISNEELHTRSEGGEYFCEEHRKKHRKDGIENTWFKHVDSLSCFQTGNSQLHSMKSNGLRVSPEQSVIVDMQVAAPEEMKKCLLENNGDILVKAFQGDLKSHVLNIRQEPVYVFLNISKDSLFVMRQNATRTLSTLVNKMVHNHDNGKVKGSITEKTFVLIEIDEIEEDVFFNQNFGYIEKTVLISYNSVFNEIESHIIVKTLKEEEKTPDFFRHKSIDIIDSLSRIERVGLFLQFVLTRKSILDKIKSFLNDPVIEGERQMDSTSCWIPVKRYIMVELVTKDPTKEGREPQHKSNMLYLNKMESVDNDVQLVSVIDIGASYSGYAYATVITYQADHLDITCNQSGKSERKQTVSSKTPCCILMTKNKELVSTGYIAEKDYEDILEDGNEENYLFFDQFKFPFLTHEVNSESMVIEDIQGNKVAAIDVFALAIKALKDDIEQHLKNTYHISDENIKWVLTIPGLWTVSGKDLMRKSAEKIGMSRKQLSIVREPDAVSIFYLNKVQQQGISDDFSSDNTFLIINIGGGSFDVSAYEIIQFNQLRKLCSHSGGPYGGTTVNTNFIEMITEIVGPNVMQSLKKEHTQSFLELTRKIETAKRVDVRLTKSKKISFSFPIFIFNELCYRFTNQNFMQLIEESKYKNSIGIADEQIWILKEVMISFFSLIVREIETEIRKVFRTVEGIEKTKMLFVGGLAGSKTVRDSIKKSFPENELVFFKESDLIVLKGAVSHGFQPHVFGEK